MSDALSTAPARGAPPASASPSGGEFFAAASAEFEAAGGALLTRDFHLAGRGVRLRFKGQGWLPGFTAALAHLAAPLSGAPDLTIDIWDDAGTGRRLGRPALRPEDFGRGGLLLPFCDARFRVGYQQEAFLLSLLDRETGHGLIWTADVRRVPRYELTFPARSIFYWWGQTRGLQMAHAGAVGSGRGGALLVGEGGSGKSTTALACLQAGLRYAGDDYVFISDPARPSAHSLYCSGKLHADHLQRLPYLLPHITNPDHLNEEKALLLLNQAYRGRLAADLPVTAIVLPRVTGQAETTYRRVSTVAALGGLAPSTVRQLPGAGRADHAFMLRFTQRLPGYALELGADIGRLPAVVARLIDDSVEVLETELVEKSLRGKALA